MKRLESRNDINKFDKMGIEFHQRIREGFLHIARNNPNRIKIIDGNGSQDEVHQEILNNITLY